MSNKSSSWERRFRYSFNRFWEKFNFLRLAKAAMKSEMCSIVLGLSDAGPSALILCGSNWTRRRIRGRRESGKRREV